MGQDSCRHSSILPTERRVLSGRSWATPLDFESWAKMKTKLTTGDNFRGIAERAADLDAAELIEASRVSIIDMGLDGVPKYLSFCRPVRPVSDAHVRNLQESITKSGVFGAGVQGSHVTVVIELADNGNVRTNIQVGTADLDSSVYRPQLYTRIYSLNKSNFYNNTPPNLKYRLFDFLVVPPVELYLRRARRGA